MRKIIGGKLYDTETAKFICNNDITDHEESYHMFEYLFKKKTGEYFLFRAMIGDYCDQAISCFNWVQEHMFRPLSVDEAKAWIVKYATADEYEQEFGLPEE